MVVIHRQIPTTGCFLKVHDGAMNVGYNVVSVGHDIVSVGHDVVSVGDLTALDSVSRPKDSSEVPGFRLERVLS